MMKFQICQLETDRTTFFYLKFKRKISNFKIHLATPFRHPCSKSCFDMGTTFYLKNELQRVDVQKQFVFPKAKQNDGKK